MKDRILRMQNEIKGRESMTEFENSQYYTNRELSWIQFNYRVLEEARDKNNPLFERLTIGIIPYEESFL